MKMARFALSFILPDEARLDGLSFDDLMDLFKKYHFETGRDNWPNKDTSPPDSVELSGELSKRLDEVCDDLQKLRGEGKRLVFVGDVLELDEKENKWVDMVEIDRDLKYTHRVDLT